MKILDDEDQNSWLSLITEWPLQLKNLPRTVSNVSEGMQQHVFIDASNSAYAAAIYIRSNENQGIKTSLIFAKSRIAPIKGITIPRLELLAILIGVRAAQFAVNQLEINNLQVTLWSDSKCALHWVQNQLSLLPKFIHNRVEKIRKANFTFRYCQASKIHQGSSLHIYSKSMMYGGIDQYGYKTTKMISHNENIISISVKKTKK